MIAALALGAALAAPPLAPPPLPRRPPIEMGYHAVARGLEVDGLSPRSPFFRAGVRGGDLIVGVGGRRANDAVFRAATRAAGTVRLELRRRGRVVRTAAVLPPARDETDPSIDVRYGEVATPGGRRRTIVTKPHGAGPFPGAIFVGGIGCMPVSEPGGGLYGGIVHALARRGIAVIRVEKSGVGDSEGRPCREVDLANEIAGYDAAATWLARQPYVDAARFAAVGHSMGGVIIPQLARPHRFRAIVAMATSGKPFFEYDLDNERRQEPLQGLNPAQVEAYMRVHYFCGERFYVEGRSIAAVVAERAACADHLLRFPSEAYLHQVARFAPVAAWQRVDAPRILLLSGSSDYVTSPDEHRLLVAAVNAVHPGRARYVEIANMDHFFRTEPSQKASFRDRADLRTLPNGLVDLIADTVAPTGKQRPR